MQRQPARLVELYPSVGQGTVLPISIATIEGRCFTAPPPGHRHQRDIGPVGERPEWGMQLVRSLEQPSKLRLGKDGGPYPAIATDHPAPSPLATRVPRGIRFMFRTSPREPKELSSGHGTWRIGQQHGHSARSKTTQTANHGTSGPTTPGEKLRPAGSHPEDINSPNRFSTTRPVRSIDATLVLGRTAWLGGGLPAQWLDFSVQQSNAVLKLTSSKPANLYRIEGELANESVRAPR